MCNILAPFFKGNISVADCMPLSSLLETIKINGGIECMCVPVYEKIAILDDLVDHCMPNAHA